jgi:hypothetical protein
MRATTLLSYACAQAAVQAIAHGGKKYTIGNQLGVGGSATVYSCYDAAAAAPSLFALKMGNHEPLIQREADMLSKLNAARVPFVPQLLWTEGASLAIEPIGQRLARHAGLSRSQVEQLVTYAAALNGAGYADWDLRDANIMLQEGVRHTGIRLQQRCPPTRLDV